MDQKIGFDLLGRAESQFHVGAVHRIARLEGNHAAPSQAGEFGAQFCRESSAGCGNRNAKAACRPSMRPPTYHGFAYVHGVVRAGMSLAGAVENRFGFGGAIGLPDFFDVQHGQHHAFGVAQRNFAAAGRELLGKFFGDVERDRHGPEDSAGQTHVVADAFVVGFGHEAAQRRKAAAHEQFEIANLTGSQVPGWPLAGVGFQFCGFFR